MKVLDVFSYAWGGIRLRKLRATLTALGVIVGVAAIVSLLSLGEGFQVSVESQLERGLPLNVLMVKPAQAFLTVNATKAINEIEGVKLSTAALSIAVSISSYNVTQTQTIPAVGINFTEYSEIYSRAFIAKSGSIPLESPNNTIILGAGVADPWKNGTLFADVGDYVILHNVYGNIANPTVEDYVFHVAAVLQEVGGFGVGGVLDNQVYIPLSTAQSIFETNTADQISIFLADSEKKTVDSVTKSILDLLNNRVIVISAKGTLNTISNLLSTLQLFLVGLAGISLLVAGIGIMNTMFVAALERTHEIGILKALGMKSRMILFIFLNEAVIIGILGATIGIILGWGLSNFFARFGLIFTGAAGGEGTATGFTIGITPILTPTIFVDALVLAILASVLFGLYPAWRASKMKPVEALRFE